MLPGPSLEEHSSTPSVPATPSPVPDPVPSSLLMDRESTLVLLLLPLGPLLGALVPPQSLLSRLLAGSLSLRLNRSPTVVSSATWPERKVTWVITLPCRAYIVRAPALFSLVSTWRRCECLPQYLWKLQTTPVTIGGQVGRLLVLCVSLSLVMVITVVVALLGIALECLLPFGTVLLVRLILLKCGLLGRHYIPTTRWTLHLSPLWARGPLFRCVRCVVINFPHLEWARTPILASQLCPREPSYPTLLSCVLTQPRATPDTARMPPPDDM